MVTPVAGVFPPPTARRVGGEHGDVRVRQAGGVHLLLRAQGDASEEAVLLRTPVEVVELPGCGEQPRKLLQIQQGLLVHPHPAALSPGVPRLALLRQLVARHVRLRQQLLPPPNHRLDMLQLSHQAGPPQSLHAARADQLC
eukprot:1196312-Prorocentrum_minimum.AAC.8